MNILVIDDDKLLLNSLKKSLELIGHNVTMNESGKEAFITLKSFTPDLILLDIKLGDMNGIDVLKGIKSQYADIPVIMITAFTDIPTVVSAMKAGAIDYIGKPLDLDQLEIVLEKIEKLIRMDKKIALLEHNLSTEKKTVMKSFSSKAMKDVLDFVKKVSRSRDTSVLIEGESGTGKEVIAKMVHEMSPRKKESYITINCGALPKDLIENELFGSEKGAFTGALSKTKKGKFELADGGSILLDEIGELSPEAQVKLLRALQEKRYYRIGGSKEISVDIRVIATTNKNLEKATETGKFREDLYYRLNVARIIIPPLRERIEDIIPLANLFINEFQQKFRKESMSLSEEAKTFLQNYYWKGNIRELRNAIERVVLFEADKIITPGHFHFISSTAPAKTHESPLNEFVLKIPREGITLAEATTKLIRETLSQTNGNKVLAAKRLGITRGKLLYRMKQLEITN